jgi:hypothetical protein
LERFVFRDTDVVTDHGLAAAVGVSRRTIIRWRKDGLTVWAADRAAAALAVHPYEIWDGWFAIPLKETTRTPLLGDDEDE